MKLKILLVIMLFVFGGKGYAQKTYNKSVDGKSKKVNKKMPKFPGGNSSFYDYLDKNVVLPEGFDNKKYKKEHHNQFVPISVGFTVDVDGSIINVKLVDGEDELLDKKAMEIVKNMPKWDPGSIDGTPVKVEYVIPVRFNLM